MYIKREYVTVHCKTEEIWNEWEGEGEERTGAERGEVAHTSSTDPGMSSYQLVKTHSLSHQDLNKMHLTRVYNKYHWLTRIFTVPYISNFNVAFSNDMKIISDNL